MAAVPAEQIEPRKKRRLHSDVPEAKENEAEPVPHEGLWFEDGNIILIAEETAFRVHRGVLSLHSEVFRNMFLVPQPSDVVEGGSTMLGLGCPFVRLHDTPEDLAMFLSILYGKRSIYYKLEHALPFADLRAMLLLAMKYQVEGISIEAIDRLEACYPFSQLPDYDCEQTRNRDGPPLAIVPEDSIAVVNLARLFDLPRLLPTALYGCCQLDTSKLLDGVRYGRELVRLSEEDVRRCFIVKDELMKKKHIMTALIMDPYTSPECSAPTQCRRGVQKLTWDGSQQPFWTNYNPLQLIDSWLDKRTGKLLCSRCAPGIGTRYNQKRLEVWEELGKIFDVSPWPV
ncbi:hypothetical protein PHLCEN_2v11779 [Hermanssonia centrifuga]|uniref:BTB domain-containing protein n=1 Tax=Hermanssonia centrifuga TaxID=98765 RepID=A0A2R6NJ52_9APHY|nr:hypothetical protein PHLCEN_2v11779 [Hermanssonia centrifuga]